MSEKAQLDGYKLLKNFLETVPFGVYIIFGEKNEYINEVLTKWIGRDRTSAILKHKAVFDELFKQGKDFTTKLESVSVGDADKKFMIKKASGYGIYRITLQMFDSFGIEALMYYFEDITDLHFAEINVQSSQSYIDNLMKSRNTEVDNSFNDQVCSVKQEVSSSEPPINVCTFMSEEDIADLEDILSTIFSLLPNISASMDEHTVQEISGLLMHFGKILAVYNETYKIAFAIQLVAREVGHNAVEFIKKATILRSPMYYFYADLETWVNKLFREGVVSVDFMNDSIVCNSYQIVDIFKKGEEEVGGEGLLF